MIVKNENYPHFKECLESVCPYIDYWVIADNGSTDGTQQFIKDFFEEKGIPGELHEVEWVDFGHNRTEALRLCDGKAGHCIMIDADDRIVGNIKIPNKLVHDGYSLRVKRGDFTWWRNQIFRTGVGWKFTGVLHEYAECPDLHNAGQLKIDKLRDSKDYYLDARTLGARNKTDDGGDIEGKEKYSRDAEVLEKALVEDPNNARYQFYLAKSYFDSQQWEKAEKAYADRAKMCGWMEEVFYSIFRVAIIKLMNGAPWPDTQDTFLQAWNVRPHRAEPLFHLARIHRLNNNPHLGYAFAMLGLDIPYPENDILFLNEQIYQWQLLDEFASTAFYVNDIDRGHAAAQRLVEMCKKGIIPESEHERIAQNLGHYKTALIKRENKTGELDAKIEAEKEKLRMKIANGKKRKTAQRKKNKRKVKS